MTVWHKTPAIQPTPVKGGKRDVTCFEPPPLTSSSRSRRSSRRVKWQQHAMTTMKKAAAARTLSTTRVPMLGFLSIKGAALVPAPHSPP